MAADDLNQEPEWKFTEYKEKTVLWSISWQEYSCLCGKLVIMEAQYMLYSVLSEITQRKSKNAGSAAHFF